MKKVLFIGMSPNHGGIETFILNVFKNLDKSNYECYFIQENDEEIFGKEFIQNNGGTILNVNVGTSYLGHLYRYYQACNFFKKNKNFFDVVHLNCVTINSTYWLRAAKKFNRNAKLIIHSHNNMTQTSSKLKDYLTQCLANHNLKVLRRLNDVTKLAASDGAGKWMFDDDNFIEIPNGIDTNEYKFNLLTRNKLKEKLHIVNNRIILSVGRMEYQKNYKKIIDVFYNMVKMDKSLKLIICGDGSKRPYIEKYIEQLKLKNNVILIGVVNNMNQMYNIADLLLMPSRYEAFPYVLVEAQCNGVPSLVSTPAVPKECNLVGNVKYLTLKVNSKEWASCAMSILDNKYDRRKANYVMSKSSYNSKNMISKIVSIYNQ